MAEILVMNRDNEHQDNAKSLRACWKRGDIVVVAEDNHPWGVDERNEAIFKIVQIPDVTKEDLEQYRQEWLNSDGTLFRRSLWRYNLEAERFINKQSGLEIHKNNAKRNR